MNRTKRLAFGILVAGLAFGFSAFTTIKRSSVLVYYKVDLTYPDADDPRGYKYYDGDMCAPGGNTCSALWDLGTNTPPVGDGEPLPTTGVTFQAESVQSGHFE